MEKRTLTSFFELDYSNSGMYLFFVDMRRRADGVVPLKEGTQTTHKDAGSNTMVNFQH